MASCISVLKDGVLRRRRIKWALKKGDTILNRGTIITVNGWAAPVSITKSMDYLHSVELVPALGANLPPDYWTVKEYRYKTASTGFSAEFTPIIDNKTGKIDLTWKANLTALKKFDYFKVDGETLERPVVEKLIDVRSNVKLLDGVVLPVYKDGKGYELIVQAKTVKDKNAGKQKS